MKRLFLALTAAALTAAACTPKTDSTLAMVVGTYTNSGSYGLYSFTFDEESGEYALLDSCRAVNPSYLTFSDDGNRIYTVNELDDGNAGVAALGFDRHSGSFTEINAEPTHGAAPCYIATNGKMVVTANYNGGSLTVFPLAEDGSLLPASAIFEGSTGGPDLSRQEAAHVHCTEFSRDGSHLFASDFSADRIMCFDVAADGSELTPSLDDQGEMRITPVVPDYGPRHIVFDRSGTHAYVIGELSGFITVFDVTDGVLNSRQVIDADPYDGRGSSDIHISPDGRFLYASNRLKGDGISIFEVDANSGELTPAGYCLTGVHPRHFNITPNGKYLLCACRDTNAIEIYSRDLTNGQLTFTGSTIELKSPVCVQFLR